MAGQMDLKLLRCQNLNIRRHVLKVGRVARHDLDRFLAAGERRMQGIVYSPAHDPSAARLPNRRFVVRQGQGLHLDRIPHAQRQLGRNVRRHLVKARERGESIPDRLGAIITIIIRLPTHRYPRTNQA